MDVRSRVWFTPGRNGYLWLLERSANGISFVDADPYVLQTVFTKLEPDTGRPEYDHERKPETGKPAFFCPSLWGGKNWVPSAFSPQTGLLYIPANNNLCMTMAGEEITYREGQVFVGADSELSVAEGGGPHRGASGMGPEYRQTGLDARVLTGVTGDPVLATGGGLVFSGGTSRSKFPRIQCSDRRSALAATHQFRDHRSPVKLFRGRSAIHSGPVRLGRRWHRKC